MHLWQCLPHMPFDVTSDSECLNILSLCSLFVWIGPCCNFVLGFCTAGPGQLFIFKLGSSEQARQQLKIEQTQHSGHAMTEAKSPTACVCVPSRLPRDGNWGSSAFLPAALALHCDGLKDTSSWLCSVWLLWRCPKRLKHFLRREYIVLSALTVLPWVHCDILFQRCAVPYGRRVRNEPSRNKHCFSPSLIFDLWFIYLPRLGLIACQMLPVCFPVDIFLSAVSSVLWTGKILTDL